MRDVGARKVAQALDVATEHSRIIRDGSLLGGDRVSNAL